MARTVSQSDTVPKRIAATVLALFIVVVIALSLLMFARVFDSRVPLTVRSDRAMRSDVLNAVAWNADLAAE